MLFTFLLILTLVFYGVFFWATKTKKTQKANADIKAFNVLRLCALSVAGFLNVMIIFFFFEVIPAGMVGVVDTYGTVSPKPLFSGVRVVSPFSDIRKFSIKTEEFKENLSLPTSQGLAVKIELSVLYHVMPYEMPTIYQSLGNDYEEKFLVTNVRSHARGVTVRYEAKDLYTSNRDQIESTMKEEIAKTLAPRGFFVEAVLIRDMKLPDELEASITRKLKSDQEAQEMEFTINKERKEADRKRIEAQGIKDFQTIVSEGISEKLLQWKGIEATIELSKSPNAKVIVIGGGKDGLPLILNSEK